MKYLTLPEIHVFQPAKPGAGGDAPESAYHPPEVARLLAWLCGQAVHSRPGSGIVHLGCGEGRVTLQLAEAHEDSRVTAIDWSANHRLHERQFDEIPHPTRIAWRARHLPNVRAFDRDSCMVEIEEFAPVAFCLIDADRTYDGARRGSESALRAMESAALENSVIAWCGYDRKGEGEWNGVRRYLDWINRPHTYHVRGTEVVFKVIRPAPAFIRMIEPYRTT